MISLRSSKPQNVYRSTWSDLSNIDGLVKCCHIHLRIGKITSLSRAREGAFIVSACLSAFLLICPSGIHKNILNKNCVLKLNIPENVHKLLDTVALFLEQPKCSLCVPNIKVCLSITTNQHAAVTDNLPHHCLLSLPGSTIYSRIHHTTTVCYLGTTLL